MKVRTLVEMLAAEPAQHMTRLGRRSLDFSAKRQTLELSTDYNVLIITTSSIIHGRSRANTPFPKSMTVHPITGSHHPPSAIMHKTSAATVRRITVMRTTSDERTMTKTDARSLRHRQFLYTRHHSGPSICRWSSQVFMAKTMLQRVWRLQSAVAVLQLTPNAALPTPIQKTILPGMTPVFSVTMPPCIHLGESRQTQRLAPCAHWLHGVWPANNTPKRARHMTWGRVPGHCLISMPKGGAPLTLNFSMACISSGSVRDRPRDRKRLRRC